MLPAPLFFFAFTGLVGSIICYIFRSYIKQLFFSDEANEADCEPLLGGVELSSKKGLSMKDIQWSNVLTLFINGNNIQLTNPDPTELLATFIREKAGLKGTKLGCEEGGCGACTVVLTKPEGIVSVNSCLRPLCANDGLAVTTVEGVGSVAEELSQEQKRLVANNGTQCGFCTPGWITNMHALNQANETTGQTSTKREIDAYLDGNICRCTGYRPIVQAFQSFANETNANSASTMQRKLNSDHPCVTNNCSSERMQGCISRGHDIDHCSGPDLEECCTGAPKKTSCGGKVGPGTLARPLGSRRAERDLALVRSYSPQPLLFFNPVTGQRWIRPVTLPQLCAVLRDVAPTPAQAQYVQLVGGNTSIGVTKYLNGSGPYNTADKYSTYIDVNQVQEMVAQAYDPSTAELTVGAATSISTLIALLNTHAAPLPVAEGQGNSSTALTTVDPNLRASESATGHVVNHHSTFSVTANHLTKIANTQVRNAGSWAGNLMVFLKYPSFPSDAVLALTTAGAQLKVCDRYGSVSVMEMPTFLSYTLSEFQNQGLMLIAVVISDAQAVNKSANSGPIKWANAEFITETFKVAQRARNAHAHVNAGFQFEVEAPRLSYANPSTGTRSSAGPPVCRNVRIVFGGVSEKLFIATRCEASLRNSPLTSETLARALSALQLDLAAAGKSSEVLGSQAFRESVMQSCLYRALLRCYPVFALPANLTSAVLPWVMPVSRGVELFSEAPVGKPVHKLEGKIQATGEAKYPSDETMPPQGLYGAIVYSTQCAKKLVYLDVSAALQLPGVVKVLTAADIPGENVGNGCPYLFVPVGELVETVGAQLGVVIATSEAAANQAASMVVASYQGDGATVPIANLQQAITKKSFFPNGSSNITVGQDITSALSSSYRRVSGHISAGGQYHFYMETQTAVACSVDGDNITVTCGSQYPSAYQATIATVLGVPLNKVVVKCPRAGGAFGGKIFRGVPVSCAAAVAAKALGRPVRIFNTRTADMAQQSGREGWLADYEVGFSADGTITALKYNFYIDAGINSDDTSGSVFMGMYWADNAYCLRNYQADETICYTNTPARTSMRAPGVVQTSFCTELVVERVAAELGLPVLQVQQRNFIADGDMAICGQVIQDCTLPTVWGTLLQRSQYEARLNRAMQYNTRSLWRKRGISICPVKYGMGWAGYNAGAQVGINQADGTVVVSHSGTEIGQGINTKAAQAVAMALGIDISLVRVGSSDTDRVVNGGCTGGSGTSEVIVQAALNACQKLNDRLAPYRNNGKFNKTPTDAWVALLKSLPYDVSLNAEGWYSPNANPSGQFFQYFVYAACVTELELDVLSGEVHVLASEIVYDCGQSLNPAVDIGQIEGALVMGLGYFLTERVQYDTETAQLLTNGTWEYKPPLAQDIPGVLNVTLLKNKFNESGVLGSKAVGEPPYVIANSVYFALKMALTSARVDAGAGAGFFDLEVPATIDVRQQAALVRPSRFVMPY